MTTQTQNQNLKVLHDMHLSKFLPNLHVLVTLSNKNKQKNRKFPSRLCYETTHLIGNCTISSDRSYKDPLEFEDDEGNDDAASSVVSQELKETEDPFETIEFSSSSSTLSHWSLFFKWFSYRNHESCNIWWSFPSSILKEIAKTDQTLAEIWRKTYRVGWQNLKGENMKSWDKIKETYIWVNSELTN